MKKVLFFILFSGFLFADVSLYKEQNLSVQLKYLNDHIDSDIDFQLGVYFGHLLKDNPSFSQKFIKNFKYQPKRRILEYSLKYSGLKNPYKEQYPNIRIVDSLTFKKYYYNSLQILIGEFKYFRDIKYLNKIYEWSKNHSEAKGALNDLKKEYPEVKKFLDSKIIKPKVIKKDIPDDEFI